MKTPRELLFARHQAATPKLDAIRRAVVAAEFNHQDTKAQSGPFVFVTWCLGGFNQVWLELIWPCRRIWSGLAMVWVLIFIVNFSQRDNISSVTGKPVRSGEVIMSLQTQQHWLNELLADRSIPPDTERPRNLTPLPRTEKSETATV